MQIVPRAIYTCQRNYLQARRVLPGRRRHRFLTFSVPTFAPENRSGGDYCECSPSRLDFVRPELPVVRAVSRIAEIADGLDKDRWLLFAHIAK